MWYIYTVDYYSDIKRNAFESVLMRWMNIEPIIQSKSEREKQVLYINAIYIESRKMVLMILVENRLVGTEGEGERGTN